MIYAVAFASFCLGFSCAVILITRATYRQPVKKHLKKLGLAQERPAKVPKRKPLPDEDFEIL